MCNKTDFNYRIHEFQKNVKSTNFDTYLLQFSEYFIRECFFLKAVTS